MIPDWNLLMPHRPLEPGVAEYVPPPSGGGVAIASWIRAGGSAVLVGGPVGIGKSTELAQAASLLQQERISCLVQLDRYENMRRLTPDQMMLRIAAKLVIVAKQNLFLEITAELWRSLVHQGVLVGPDFPAEGVSFQLPARDLLNQVIAELGRRTRGRRIVLLIDGLEKVRPPADAAELFEALASLDEHLDLAVVVPWDVAFGPRALVRLIRENERLISLAPSWVVGDEGKPGREFLRAILTQRLKWGAEFPSCWDDLVTEAILCSGGIPRLFLNIIASAGTDARQRNESYWPDAGDMERAIYNLRQDFRRSLLPGDTDAIRKALGTDGREMELDRRIRLMARGVLLEDNRGSTPTLFAHPLVRDALDDGSAHA